MGRGASKSFMKALERGRAKERIRSLPKAADVRLGQEYIDLTEHLHIDDFDRVVRAVHGVIDQSDSLSLDSADDREVIKSRLLKALGCVVEPWSMRLQKGSVARG